MLLVVKCHNEVEDFVANFLRNLTEEWAVFLGVDGILERYLLSAIIIHQVRHCVLQAVGRKL